MKVKLILTIISITILFLLSSQSIHAQMMGNITPITQQDNVTPSTQDLEDIQLGQDLFNRFQNKQTTCTQLKEADFEKIGEYLMNQSFGGNSNAHIQMNTTMKQMMGETGEEQMHIRLGKNATGCNANGQGGGRRMMNWNYGGMMGWNNGFSIFPFLIQLFILVDLILIAVWFWKKIKK